MRRIATAEVELQDRQASLALYRRIGDPRATTQEEMNRREFAVQSAQARVAEAKAAAAEARAAVEETSARLVLRTVRAPADGTVLRVKARPGQFAPAALLADPLVTMGNLDPLHVRVDLDEADMTRISATPKARISARGSNGQTTTAELVRIEPLVVPKRSLTNAVSERVDTRVLQLVFALPKGAQGFRVGQQVDAFIDAGAPR